MLEFLWIAGTGWLAIIFLGLVSLLPFVLRFLGANGALQIGGMRVHYFLGFAIPAFAAAHSFSTMRRLQNASTIGLWFAAIALTALFVQVTLGTELRAVPWGQPKSLRRWHLMTMIAAAMLIVGHVVLDRA
jgi:hypothetical protein